MEISFFMPMIPPTATAQERQSTMKGGKHVTYRNARLERAEDTLTDGLYPHRPAEPLKGPLRLSVVWLFPAGGKTLHGAWRATRPDTDNLNKLLKDCSTSLGFWHDDAQVVWEECRKVWTRQTPGIHIRIETLDESSGLT